VVGGPPTLDLLLDGTLPGKQLASVVNTLLLVLRAGEMGSRELVELPARGVKAP
jgi:hypothetical protein